MFNNQEISTISNLTSGTNFANYQSFDIGYNCNNENYNSFNNYFYCSSEFYYPNQSINYNSEYNHDVNNNYLYNYNSVFLSQTQYASSCAQSFDSNTVYLNDCKQEKQEENTGKNIINKNQSEIVNQESKCQVCDESPSGYHYGAYTCEACKLFYSRISKNKRKKKYDECKSKTCVITPKNRSKCPDCRYKKCLSIGMSLNKSKYGRNINIKQIRKLAPDTIKNLPSYDLIGLFNNAKSIIEFSIQILSIENLYQTENQFCNTIKEFYDKVLTIIDKDHISDESTKIKYKFLENHLTMPELETNSDQYFKKLDLLFLFFCWLFQIDYKFKLDFIYNTTQIKTKQLFFLNKIEPSLNEIMSSFNKLIQNFDSNTILVVKIYSFVHVMLHLLQINRVDFNQKLDKLIIDLMKTELTSAISQQNCSSSFTNANLSSSSSGYSSLLDQSVNSNDPLNFVTLELLHYLSSIVILLNFNI